MAYLSMQDRKEIGWPENLYREVVGKELQVPPDVEETLLAQMAALPERMQSVLLGRFRDFKTFPALAEELNVSLHTARQDESRGLMKLRRPQNARIIVVGLAEHARIAEERRLYLLEEDRQRARLVQKWESLFGEEMTAGILEYQARYGTLDLRYLDLGIATWLILFRKGMSELTDLLQQDRKSLLRLEGIGPKRLSFIEKALAELNIYLPECGKNKGEN